MARQVGDSEMQRIGDGSIPADWFAEFEAAARRPLELRMKYAFIKTYKPVLDDEPYRNPLCPPL